MSMFSRFRNSRLATRATLLFAGSLLLVMGGSLLLLCLFFLSSIAEIENQFLTRSNHQARETINLRLNEMATRSIDWAYWDETYRMLTIGDPDYRQRNLNVESLHANDVDLMLFLDRRGQIRLGCMLDENHSELRSLSAAIQQQLLSETGIGSRLAFALAHPDVELKPVSGIITLQGSPWLIAMTPVLSSEFQGPVAGWMIWGKSVNAFFPSRFMKILTTEAQLKPADTTYRLSKQATPVSSPDPEVQLWLQGDRLLAYSDLLDINQHRIAQLEVTTPRTLYHTGQLSLWILLGTNLLGGGILLFLFLRLFRRHISDRFHSLEEGLRQLAHSNWSAQLSVEGKDEIALASRVINQLLASRQNSSLELQEIEQKFAALYQNSAVGILMLHEGRLMNMNDTALQLLGYQQAQAPLGLPFATLLPADHAKEPYSAPRFQKMLQLGQHSFEWELVTSHGSRLPCELNLVALEHSGKDSWLITLHDITERRNNESKIKRLSLYDSLTGLLNRHQLQALLDHDLDEQRLDQDKEPFSILYIDIVHFKHINDTFGHGVGDQLLHEVAQRLNAACPKKTLSRIAADEFVLYLPTLKDRFEPLRTAQQLQARLAEPFRIEHLEIQIQICVGIVVGRLEFHTAEEVLRCADYALCKAKQGPQSIRLFTRRLYREAIEAMMIKRDLATAIRQDQLMAWFQPIVDSQSGQVVGLEALVRWKHLEMGYVSPAKFIPIAEEGHLIIELGEKVLQMACDFAVQLNACRARRNLPPLIMHVNLSARHFASPHLLPLLEQTLLHSGLPASQLAVEITETTLLESPRDAIRRMHAIRQLGIHLALDDFGTGYSALNTLCQYPIDMVKLDRSFVLRLMEGKQGELLVRAIINMARDLGLDVIAEGVELQAQRDKLVELGIRQIQGFYYYRPMSGEDLGRLNAC